MIPQHVADELTERLAARLVEASAAIIPMILAAATEVERERVRVLEEALQKIGKSTGCVDACPCWAKLRREAMRALPKGGDDGR